MKIIYWYNQEDPKYGFTKDIESSLKKKHKVESINDREFDIEELVKKCKKADLLLFHQGGIHMENEINYSVSLERLKQILQAVKCKKVCWFLEKVWFLNNETMEQIIPFADYIFLNDGTWARRHNYENVFALHSGAGKSFKGKPQDKYKCDIAFYGMVHGFRKPFINMLKDRYGRRFKVFNFAYGPELADLIASSKLIFSPIQPNDEFYWDNRIYEVLNYGGTLVHPKLYGLEEEGFIFGKHYLGYKTVNDLIETIDKALEEGTGDIAETGRKFVQKYTWDNRIKTLMDKIQ